MRQETSRPACLGFESESSGARPVRYSCTHCIYLAQQTVFAHQLTYCHDTVVRATGWYDPRYIIHAHRPCDMQAESRLGMMNRLWKWCGVRQVAENNDVRRCEKWKRRGPPAIFDILSQGWSGDDVQAAHPDLVT